MRKESYTDRKFRQYGEEFFGKIAMDQITAEQVETARVWAMNELEEITRKYGRAGSGAARELFCNYVFSEYM